MKVNIAIRNAVKLKKVFENVRIGLLYTSNETMEALLVVDQGVKLL